MTLIALFIDAMLTLRQVFLHNINYTATRNTLGILS